MSEAEIVKLDMPLWDGWTIVAAELNPRGWAKVFVKKDKEILLGKLCPDPPQLILPEALGEYNKETELTIIRDLFLILTKTVEAAKKECLRVMHGNIEALLIEAAKDDNPKMALQIENTLKTLYEKTPDVLGHMALSEDYSLSIRAVPARLFGKLARIELKKEADLLTRLLSHPEEILREATLQGISEES